MVAQSERGGFCLIDAATGRRIGERRIKALSNGFRDFLAGRPEPVIALHVADRTTFFASLLALGQLDVRIVPLQPVATPQEVAAYGSHAGATHLITDQRVAGELGDGCEVVPTSICAELLETEAGSGIELRDLKARLLFYTSGSTGAPKGVPIDPGPLRANVDSAVRRLPHRAGGTTASVLPGWHTFTLVSDVLTALHLGNPCVVCAPFTTESVKAIIEAFVRYGVTSFSGVPILFEVLTAFGGRLNESALEFAVSGAAPLTERVRLRYERTFSHTLVPCYGLTEAVCFVTISDPAEIVPGSAGKPIIDLRVVDAADQPLPANALGEIQIRGSSVLERGYYRASASPTSLYSEDGWLKTGDLGYLDSENNLFIRGRCRNMIIRGGEKVYLDDVEALFETGSTAGVPIGGENGVESYALFVEGSASEQPQRTAAIREALGSRHLPDRWIFVEALPKSATGKILRSQLSERVTGS